MIDLTAYISESQWLSNYFDVSSPWQMTTHACYIIEDLILKLNTADFRINNGIAVHRSAVVEQSAILKPPIIISANVFVAAHAYLRGGVFLDHHVSVGPGCEVKSSFLFSNTSLAHFNFVGDSIVGSRVNMEAGSVIANHYNERANKSITVNVDDKIIPTGVSKFGALVGDEVKIGANAVLSPGTILKKKAVVERLQLL